MKKLLLSMGLAIAALTTMTSCNSDSKTVVYPAEVYFTQSVGSLMTSNLVYVVWDAEKITKMIAEGKDAGVTTTATGWEYDFDTNGTNANFTKYTTGANFYAGKISVTVSGPALADGSIKTVDCSRLKINNMSGIIGVYGNIDITNTSTAATSWQRSVRTYNDFGWGISRNEVSLNGNYAFDYIVGTAAGGSDAFSKCSILGSGSGHNDLYGSYSQQIAPLAPVTMPTGYNDLPFSSGTINYTAEKIDNYTPINVVYTDRSFTIEHNGVTTVYP